MKTAIALVAMLLSCALFGSEDEKCSPCEDVISDDCTILLQEIRDMHYDMNSVRWMQIRMIEQMEETDQENEDDR